MRHDYVLTGHSHRIRPVKEDDASLIATLRAGRHARLMHTIDPSETAQRAFIEDYLRRPFEYYFVVERLADDRPEGLSGLVDVDHPSRKAQWGRTVLRPFSLAAPDLSLLMLHLAFETLDLSEVWGATLAQNQRMLAFAQSLGFERERCCVTLDGISAPAFKLVLTKERWMARERDVRRVAEAGARMMGRAAPRNAPRDPDRRANHDR